MHISFLFNSLGKISQAIKAKTLNAAVAMLLNKSVYLDAKVQLLVFFEKGVLRALLRSKRMLLADADDDYSGNLCVVILGVKYPMTFTPGTETSL